MSSTLRGSINTLRATVTDGRVENVRHRQNELHKLHSVLRQESESICDAISKSSNISISDAEKEYFLAMDAIQKSYETLNFDQSQKDEYLVKEGKSNLKRRIGAGLVAIRPTQHTRFYSIVTPLVAAIAAGNCILLEVRLKAIQADNEKLNTDIARSSSLYYGPKSGQTSVKGT
jgi:acyl-CoA reductase-like NAD-dependent aldehyde dehydrogenase